MFSTKAERDYLRKSDLGKTIRQLTSCNRYVQENDNVTAAERLREVSLAIMKCCAIALESGPGKDGKITSGLGDSDFLDFEFYTYDVGLALCGAITLLDQGTELAELTREMALEGEPTDSEPETEEPTPTEVDASPAGMPVVRTFEQLQEACEHAANEGGQS